MEQVILLYFICEKSTYIINAILFLIQKRDKNNAAFQKAIMLSFP